MGSANERRRYIVTSSLIGWAHTRKDPVSPTHVAVSCPVTMSAKVPVPRDHCLLQHFFQMEMPCRCEQLFLGNDLIISHVYLFTSSDTRSSEMKSLTLCYHTLHAVINFLKKKKKQSFHPVNAHKRLWSQMPSSSVTLTFLTVICQP